MPFLFLHLTGIFPSGKTESSSWMAKEKEAERMTLLERKLFICRIWMTENKYFMDDDSALFIPEADRRDLKLASIKSHLQGNQKNLVVALLVRGLQADYAYYRDLCHKGQAPTTLRSALQLHACLCALECTLAHVHRHQAEFGVIGCLEFRTLMCISIFSKTKLLFTDPVLPPSPLIPLVLNFRSFPQHSLSAGIVGLCHHRPSQALCLPFMSLLVIHVLLCAGQRRVFRSQPFPSTLQVSGLQLRSSGLAVKSLYPRSRLSSPALMFQ